MPSTRSGFLTPNNQQPIGNYGQQRKSLWDRIGGALSGVGRGVGAVGGGITDMLSAAGGAYAPSDLELTKMQQIGLLGKSMRDMQYGPGAPTSPAGTTISESRFGLVRLESARINQERTDLENAITNYFTLNPASRKSGYGISSNATATRFIGPDNLSQCMEKDARSSFAPTASNQSAINTETRVGIHLVSLELPAAFCKTVNFSQCTRAQRLFQRNIRWKPLDQT